MPCNCIQEIQRTKAVKCSSDNDSFYISSNTAFGNTSTKWFKSQPVGINKISGFLKIMITNAGTFHWLHVILTSFKFVFKLTKQKLKIIVKLACIQMQTNNIKLSYNYAFCHLHAVTWHHANILYMQ
jgi:hypothetical protein